jgi:hypothetical protein
MLAHYFDETGFVEFFLSFFVSKQILLEVSKEVNKFHEAVSLAEQS